MTIGSDCISLAARRSPLLAILKVVVLFAGLTAAVAEAQTAPGLVLIVEMKTPFAPEGELGAAAVQSQRAAIASDRQTILGALPAGSFQLKNSYESVPGFALRISPLALPVLQTQPLVASLIVDMTLAPNLAQSRVIVGANQAESVGFSGSGSVVAVLDTGVQNNHPSLSGKVISEACYSTTDQNQQQTSCAQTGKTARKLAPA